MGTRWDTRDIWLRREIELPAREGREPSLWLHHDEDVEIYINGVLAASAGGFTSGYEDVALTSAGKSALKAGRNLIAVHCRQTSGGQYIDLGFVDLERR